MIRTFLWRGFKAGLAAGLLFGLFVALVGGPMVGFAHDAGNDHVHDGQTHESGDHNHEHAHDEHAHNDGHAHDNGHAHDDGHSHAVSGLVTTVVSIAGGIVWGILLGVVVFGALFYFLEPAIPGTGAIKSVLLGAGGFVTVAGAPWLVVPPQPGGVEQAMSQDARFFWFGAMMLAGAVACLLAFLLYNRTRSRGWLTASALALAPLVALVALGLAAPTNSLSGGVSHEVITAFQGAALLGQVVLWGTLAAVHAWLHNPRERPEAKESEFPSAAD